MRAICLAPALLLAACQQAATPANEAEGRATVDPVVEPAPPSTRAPVANASVPGRDEPPPVHLDPDAPPLAPATSAQGAARRLLEYCDALATRRFGDAYRLWADEGKASGLTQLQFTERFRGVRISDCVIGKAGPIEGAAGSLYIEIANRMRGTARDGRPLAIDGPVMLRRVNDVDGSTARQREWHIARAPFPPA